MVRAAQASPDPSFTFLQLCQSSLVFVWEFWVCFELRRFPRLQHFKAKLRQSSSRGGTGAGARAAQPAGADTPHLMQGGGGDEGSDATNPNCRVRGVA